MRISLHSRRVAAFSIAEVVMAGFLLTTGILSIMGLFTISHKSSLDTRHAIIAAQLAQEGVELVRNVRDNNIAHRAENWITGDLCSTSTNGNCDPFRHFPNNKRCAVEYTDSPTADINCPAGSATYKLFLNNSGFYTYGSGSATPYYRVVSIDRTGSAETARVQSFVSWTNPGSHLNGSGATDWCNPFNKCVYTELLLSYWK